MILWKKNLYAVWIAEFFAIVGFGCISPFLPFYVQELGISDSDKVKLWVGLIQGSGSVALALSAPVWGRLADYFGRRVMLVRAFFGGTVMMILMGLATHPWQLALFRGIGGLLTGTVTAATVLVATTVPDDRAGASLGLLQSAILIGAAVGPVLGGVFSDLLGYRPTFFISAGFFLTAGIIILKFVRENFTRKPVPGSLLKKMLPDFSIISRSRNLISLLLVIGVIYFANSILTPILPLFIQSLTDFSDQIGSTTGLIIGLRALAGALASVFIGRVSDRIGYRRVLITCLLGGVLTHLPLIWVTTPIQLLIARVAGGFFIGGTLPSLNALVVARSNRSIRGAVYGLSSSMKAAGTAVGPMVGAGAAAIWDFSAVFLIITIVLLGTTALVAATTGRSSPGFSRAPRQSEPPQR